MEKKAWTLLQCSVCGDKSYLFCCDAVADVLFTVCQPCVLGQEILEHNCNHCENQLFREVSNLRNSLMRELQRSKRNSGRVSDPWNQPPNLSLGNSHHTYPPAKTGNGFMKQNNPQRTFQNQLPQNQNNIFSPGVGKNQMANQGKN